MQFWLRVILVAAALASITSAHAALSVSPPLPTSNDEITLLVPLYCGIATSTVTRTGRDLSVTLTAARCADPPYLSDRPVPIGRLPAGEYHAVVTYPDLEPQSRSFIVFEADPIVTVRPFVVPPNIAGYPIQLTFKEGFSVDPGCGQACYVEIGGVKYTGNTPLYAPNLAPGIHDIKIVTDKGTFTSAAAIYYQSADTPPHPQIFEPVLFPVLSRSRGTNGSDWRSEAVILNPTTFPILNANTIDPKVCVTYPCGEKLDPKSRTAFEGDQYAHGVALMVPRVESNNLAYSLRVRDVSRESGNFGTTIPVVRERDMVRGGEAMRLLDVPLDRRYRTKVRVYAFPTESFQWAFAGATMVFANGGRIPINIGEMKRTCSGASCAWTPFYGEVDLGPLTAQGERVDLYVTFTPGLIGWAFVSVTNNETQHVTVITPAGGQP